MLTRLLNGLANVDTFIIRVGFGLATIDTIHTLTRHEYDPLTRIVTPSSEALGGICFFLLNVEYKFFLV